MALSNETTYRIEQHIPSSRDDLSPAEFNVFRNMVTDLLLVEDDDAAEVIFDYVGAKYSPKAAELLNEKVCQLILDCTEGE